MTAEIPVLGVPLLSVPVMVVGVPITECDVNVTVATPLPFVVEFAIEKEPFASDFVQFTVLPEIETGLLYVSANCAVIKTFVPATGDVVAGVTIYLASVSALAVAVIFMGETPEVETCKVCVPARVPSVQVVEATPLALVVVVVLDTDPLSGVKVTVAPEITLLLASLIRTVGVVVPTATPKEVVTVAV